MRGLTPAQKKAAMRATPEEDPEFQIAPMIDILLVLLVFFMSIASTEVLQTNDKVHLPIAKDAKDRDASNSATKGQVIINVLWNEMGKGGGAGTIDVDERAYPQPGDIVPLLQKAVTANPNVRVLVRADKNVRYEYTRQLLQAVGTAGVGNVTFSVVDKENASSGGTAAPNP